MLTFFFTALLATPLVIYNTTQKKKTKTKTKAQKVQWD